MLLYQWDLFVIVEISIIVLSMMRELLHRLVQKNQAPPSPACSIYFFFFCFIFFHVQVVLRGFSYGGLSEVTETDILSCSYSSVIGQIIWLYSSKNLPMIRDKVNFAIEVDEYKRAFCVNFDSSDIELALQVCWQISYLYSTFQDSCLLCSLSLFSAKRQVHRSLCQNWGSFVFVLPKIYISYFYSGRCFTYVLFYLFNVQGGGLNFFMGSLLHKIYQFHMV